MNLRAVFKYVGYIVILEGLFMIPPVLISAFRAEKASVVAFLITIALCIVIGAVLVKLKKTDRGIYAREGFITVALSWIIMSIMGALPFLLSGAIKSPIDCWFETVSGFTTTGASILTDVERLPYGLLYWRSFTIWLGGMGVLVFMLAVIPLSKGSGETFHLLKAESPGPSVGKLTPTMRQTARVLYTIYIGMTLIEIVLLLLGGMSLFDSVTNAFSTAGTGGFTIKNASIAAYDSTYLQAVIGVFMMLFGINFSLYYLILLKQFRAALRNEELRAYIGIIIGVSAIITLNIFSLYNNFGKALLDSFFQVSSIITTTGFATANFDTWPELSRLLLVILMIFGASAGSTGGGIKISRALILWKSLRGEILKMLRPRAVRPVLMDGKLIDDTVVRGTNAFMSAYFLIAIVSMMIVALDNFSLETTITSVLTCLNNVGPGLGLVGPAGNFSALSTLSKLALSFDMLLGRLEIFPIVMLFSPSVWRRKA